MKKHALLLAGCLILSGSLWAGEGVSITGCWVRAMPPGQQATACYCTFENGQTKAAGVTGGESPLFARVELHESLTLNGVAMMKAVKELAVPPRGKVVLQPGGLHIMLIAPQRHLKMDEKVPLTFTFADGSRQTVEAVVRQGPAMGNHEHQHAPAKPAH
ncbi:MAG: copper chaperone PCu(A)C [Magnetococcales bacterium]|nr:copper chaperone PCu(A)C [Magnetococcales bacterium]